MAVGRGALPWFRSRSIIKRVLVVVLDEIQRILSILKERIPAHKY
jgi:hypothetical protein